MEIHRFFDRNYSSTERYWWLGLDRYETDPDAHSASLLGRAILREAAQRPPGRALDVGGGEGTDSIRLAMLGWEVDFIDVSSVGVEKARAFADALGVRINARKADVQNINLPNDRYDIVVANGSLHYVEDKSRAIAMIQASTKLGGVNALALWSNYSPVPDEYRIVPCFPDSEDGVVTRMYSLWDRELLYFERLRQESGHTEFDPHVHSYIKMFARKIAL